MAGEKGLALLIKNLLPANLFEGIEEAKKNIGGAIANFDARLAALERNQILLTSLARAIAKHHGITAVADSTPGVEDGEETRRSGTA